MSAVDIYEKAKVDLKETPETLQSVVKNTLEGIIPRKLLFVEKVIWTPYDDKSLIETVWKAYIDCCATMVVLTVSDCPNASWNRSERVDTEIMGVVDILVFVEHSDLLRSKVSQRLSEIEKNPPGLWPAV